MIYKITQLNLPCEKSYNTPKVIVVAMSKLKFKIRP